MSRAMFDGRAAREFVARCESGGGCRRYRARGDELERDFFAIFIVRARCEIDRAQTAPADFAKDLVSAELTAGERFFIRRFWEQVPRDIKNGC